MTRKHRWWIALALLAVLALLGWALAPRPLPVEVATASAGRFELAIVEDGRTRLRERHLVSAPLAGRLERITLREGDTVAAGAAVAVLLPLPAPMLDARTQAELQGRRQAAEAGVQRASALVGQQQTQLAQAQTELKRSEQLAQQGFIAPIKLDSDRLAVQAAQQGLSAAQQARHVAAHELEVVRAAQTVQLGLASGRPQPFTLRSPVAGQVLKVHPTSEGIVAAGTPLVELGDTAALEVVAELLTTEALRVPPGAAVLIERWGGPDTLAGRVRRVEPGGFTKVSALGVEEQRVRVLIDLAAPPAAATDAGLARRLGDGYRVGVRILTQVQDNALMVPVSAVFPRPGQPEAMAVFVLHAGHARLKPVLLGGRNSEAAWVREGLAAGEQVIVYPPAAVADGVRVAARDPQRR
jgi:HlyD family secretion protein